MPVFPSRPQDVLESRFEDSVYDLNRLPGPDSSVPEIAFAGRSNVGKSSLINAMIGRKNLARTSNTPGKTRALNLYRCRVRSASGEGELLLVDLPGYGYAKVPKSERRRWEPLVENYLGRRDALWGVVLVIDGRRAPMDSDVQMADYLGRSGLSWVAVLTKTDRAKQKDLSKALKNSEGLLRSLGARDVRQVSATERRGIEPVWEALADLGPVVPS